MGNIATSEGVATNFIILIQLHNGTKQIIECFIFEYGEVVEY